MRILSNDARRIITHLSPAERKIYSARLKLLAIWATYSFLLPMLVVFGIRFGAAGRLVVLGLIGIIAIGIAGLAISLNRLKSFLCLTEWAQEQGYAGSNLKLFS